MKRVYKTSVCRPSLQSQRGMVTLVISLTVLMLSTYVVFNVSKAVLMEQKISNNETRAKQAFEAAEAGMQAAFSYLDEDPDRDGDNFTDPVFDTDANGVGDSNTATFGRATVVVTVPAAPSASMNIVSQGFSDDRSATKTISQNMTTIDPLPNRPQNPLIVRGSALIGGSATVHNPEGFSTIWTGGDIDMGSNNTTATEVPDLADPDYPGCMDFPKTETNDLSCGLVDASSKLVIGLDVIEHDESLGSLTDIQFFQNFFGMNPTAYHSSMVTIDTVDATAYADANLATHEVIWIDGDVDFNGITVGCTEEVNGNNVCPDAKVKPSIVIVSGDASFGGNCQFYGILYVMGDADLTGNVTVHGSAVIAGAATSTAGGSLDIWYHSDILFDTSLAGSSAGGAGSWQDF